MKENTQPHFCTALSLHIAHLEIYLRVVYEAQSKVFFLLQVKVRGHQI